MALGNKRLLKFGGHNLGVVGYSVEQHYNQFRELLDATNNMHCFELDGEIFSGNAIYWIKKYCAINPSKPFRIWLIDLGLKMEHK